MRQGLDTFKHKGQRAKLVADLQAKGITSANVLEAINTVLRHVFFQVKELEMYAYEDKAYPIGSGQTISQPFTVAFQSQLLDVKKQEKVLEIGTGSGYQTAVLLELGARVFTVERQKHLFVSTSNLLPTLGYRANCFLGDGYKGLPNYGPFDKILITAAPPLIPEELLKQLKIGGKLVSPVGGADAQVMLEIIRKDADTFEQHEHGRFSFVPMLSGLGDDR